MAKEYACRRCKGLSAGKVCPNCNATDLSPEWAGLVIVIAADRSEVAKTLGIIKPGRYALKVS